MTMPSTSLLLRSQARIVAVKSVGGSSSPILESLPFVHALFGTVIISGSACATGATTTGRPRRSRPPSQVRLYTVSDSGAGPAGGACPLALYGSRAWSGWNPDTVSDSGAGAGCRLRLPGAALWPSTARAPDQAVGIVPDP